MGVIAHCPKAIRKSFLVDLPCSRVNPTPVVDVPASVHPPIVGYDFLFYVTFDKKLLNLLSCVRHFISPEGSRRRHPRAYAFSSRTRNNMREHPPTPDILGTDPSPLVKLQRD